MKRSKSNIIWSAVVVLAILAVVGFYFYDVLYLDKPFTENLFRAVLIILTLVGTLFKLLNGGSRKSLDVYEKAYAKELGFAFQNKPMQRKKLLCACRLYDESNYGKSLKYLYQLLKEAEFERDAVPVLLFIALCYTDVGVHNEAIKVYKDLIKLDPRNAQAHSNLGLLYVAVGEYEFALEQYNDSIEYAPHNYYAYINRANLYFRIKEYDNAVNDAKTALEFKNNGVEAASLLTIICALQGDEENKQKYYHISITSGKKPSDLNEAIEYYLNEVDEESDENNSDEDIPGEE